MKNLFFLFLALLVLCVSQQNSIHISEGTCDLSVNPVGVESALPRLGWQLASSRNGDYQTAYEIKVAGTTVSLKDAPDIWQTGKVVSAQSQYIPYAGKPLESGKTYFWQVRVWDSKGNPSAWSDVYSWTTALSASDWNGQWIGAIHQRDANLPSGRDHATYHGKVGQEELWAKVNPLAKRSILLRKDFVLDATPETAVIYVSGLGHYDLFVNGRQVDNSHFKPLWSDYHKTIYYNTFDIADLLEPGENVIGVVLGNGMYNVTGNRYSKFRVSFGPPTLLLQADLTLPGGNKQQIVSDGSWTYIPGPTLFNCMFGGEDYDATLEQPGWNARGFNDSDWQPVVLQDAPRGKLRAQAAPPVKIMETFDVAHYKKTGPDTYLFDMGQNLSGFPTIRLDGKKGQKIRMVVAEILNADSTRVMQENSGAPYYFEYTLKGGGPEEWTPQFSYYGYQYIEIAGINYLKSENENLPTVLELKSNFVYSSAPEDGTFACSNELFNQTHRIIGRATRSNMQAVFTDCPHREKLGWLEETHLNGPGLLFNYDLRTFYRKQMDDIRDAQLENGMIPDIAPEYVIFGGGFRDSPEWGSAGVIVPWMYYEWYGDDSLIKEFYPVMKKYTDYLSTKAEDNLLIYGLGDWCDYGDRELGFSQNTPMGITATGHYYMVADYTAKAAAMLGNTADQSQYAELARQIAGAFNAELFDPETRQYGNGSQCSNAMPLFIGIVPESDKDAVVQNLFKSVEANGWKLSTGDVGNRYLYQALAQNGGNDVMYRMHNHREVPGYGFQLDVGVTTLTEQWDPHRGSSWNHFMMGHIEEWFYKSLAGINPDPEHPGFKHFTLRPQPLGDLTHAKATYNSIYGPISSEWEIKNGTLIIKATVPVNTTATLYVPVGNKEEVELGSGKHTLRYKL